MGWKSGGSGNGRDGSGLSVERWDYLPEEPQERRRRALRRLRRRLRGWPAAIGKSLALLLFLVVIWQITGTRPPPRLAVVAVDRGGEPGAAPAVTAPLIHRLEPPPSIVAEPAAPAAPPVVMPSPEASTSTPARESASAPPVVPPEPAASLEAAPREVIASPPPEPAPRRPELRLGGEERQAEVAPVAEAAIALLHPEAGELEAAPSPLPVVVVPAPPPSPRHRPGAPVIAIVIDDVGPALGAARRAIRLPAPVTLSFLPYAEQLDRLVADAARAGHEIMLHLPMEPVGDEDPGPGALLASLPEPVVARRVREAIARLPGAVGVNNHMGSRVTAMPVPMAVVMDELRAAGLYFIDSRTTASSVAEAVAIRTGVPTTGRDVFLDNELDAVAIRRQLANTERIARRRGWAVAIGHPHAITLQILSAWIPDVRRRGFELVPASRAVMLDECHNERSGCSGLLTVSAP
jgi:polysaccharide deacetylase 2 family uncharacterized protein YibQ